MLGDQRFVLPLPPTRDEDKSGLMAVADFDPMAGKSVIFDLRSRIRADWRALTFATPGRPNSPDYSGYISSGSFE